MCARDAAAARLDREKTKFYSFTWFIVVNIKIVFLKERVIGRKKKKKSAFLTVIHHRKKGSDLYTKKNTTEYGNIKNIT